MDYWVDNLQRIFVRLAGLCAGLGLGLGGCAKIADWSVVPFESNISATAIVNGVLLHGKVRLLPGRTGTVRLGTDKGSALTCMGPLRYTGTVAGTLELRCSDGVGVDLRFTLLSEARGYAYGETAAGPGSLVFGLSAQEAKAYLSVPAGKTLVEQQETGRLEML